MHERQSDMLQGSVVKPILLFFFPILFGSLFQQLYNTVDAMVVGNFVGKEALGAVGGATATFIELCVGFVLGLSSGATVVVAQYYGSHELEGVRKGVSCAMFLAVALGICMSATGIIFAPYILKALNVPAEIYPYSLTYMRIYLAGMIPLLIYNNGAGILRAIGDSRRPLYFLIASALTNIVLDLLFVVVFHMGVAGVGLATVIAQIVACTLTLYSLGTTNDIYRFSFREMKLDSAVFRRILIIGIPMGLQSCMYAVSNLFVHRGINAYGTDTVAANTAFGRIDALFWNSSNALGQSCLTFCGQNFGAGNIKRVRKGIRTGIIMYMIGSAAISSFLYVYGSFFFHLFTNDVNVIEIGLSILRFQCPFWIVFSIVEVLSCSLRACGDSLFPMIMTTMVMGVFRISWILFYPAKGLFDTIRCYPISWSLLALLYLVYYLQGGWLKRCLSQKEKLMEANRA